MTWVEAVVEAFKLFVLTVGYAIDEARKREARIEDANARRALFEAIVLKAMTELRTRAGDEKVQVDAVDEKIDEKN